MSESRNAAQGGGVGFAGLLTIAFIVLKLCNVIDWSWWWVLSPIWISVGIVLAVVAMVSLVVVLFKW
jgi:ABC-type nickel/cobalt efflux system permease component RcnA